MQQHQDQADVLARLSAYVGKPGLYLERGFFARGILTAVSLPEDNSRNAGYLQLTTSCTVDGATEELRVGSVHLHLAAEHVQAVGYVSSAWVFGANLLEGIERRIQEEGVGEEDTSDCYALARKVIKESDPY